MTKNKKMMLICNVIALIISLVAIVYGIITIMNVGIFGLIPTLSALMAMIIGLTPFLLKVYEEDIK